MPSPFQYREFPPGQQLSAAVECLWAGTAEVAPQTTQHRILPDGCMDLLFDFTDAASPRVAVIGTMSKPHTFTTAGRVNLLGVRFRPGGLTSIVPLDAAELADGRADLSEFWGRRANEIWHRVAEAGPAERAPLLHEMLCARGGGPMDPYIRHCVARIEAARGDLRIADLERSTGLSSRQLERRFARELGVSPKRFARIVRFRSIVAAAEKRGGPPDWAALACDLGFADQSHLVREFRAFSGLTPTGFMENPDDPAGDVGFLQDE